MLNPEARGRPSTPPVSSGRHLLSRLLQKLLKDNSLLLCFLSLMGTGLIWVNHDSIVSAWRLWGLPLSVREIHHFDRTTLPILLGSLEQDSALPENLYIQVRLDFRADRTVGYPNLFQTDSVNSGIRAEVSGETLAVIVGNANNPGKPGVLVLSSDLKVATWYTLELVALNNTVVEASLAGASRQKLSGDLIQFRSNDVRVGEGFNPDRRFTGEIRNTVISAGIGRSAYFGELAFLAMVVVAALGFVALLIMSIKTLWSNAPWNVKRRALRDAFTRWDALAKKSDLVVVGGILSLALAGAYFVAWGFFQGVSLAVRPTLLPGFEPEMGAHLFKSEGIFYVLIELALVSVVAASWLVSVLRIKIPRVSPPVWLPVALSLIALAAMSKAPHMGDKLLCGFAVWLFATAAASGHAGLRRLLLVPGAASAYFFRHLSHEARAAWLRIPLLGRVRDASAPPTKTSKWARLGRAGGAACLLAVAASLAITPLLKAWFPVSLPNDYYELADKFRIAPNIFLDREEMLQCLQQAAAASETARNPADPSWACPAPKAAVQRLFPSALLPMAATSGWQGETGRILYHHSYIFVPAVHFLAYGFDGALPYLYGYGNTLFHAALMSAAGRSHALDLFQDLSLGRAVRAHGDCAGRRVRRAQHLRRVHGLLSRIGRCLHD